MIVVDYVVVLDCCKVEIDVAVRCILADMCCIKHKVEFYYWVCLKVEKLTEF